MPPFLKHSPKYHLTSYIYFKQKYFQVTVPRYRENPLITKFSMLCAEISQNCEHHHLTLYKGGMSKAYRKLCGKNILYIYVDNESGMKSQDEHKQMQNADLDTQIPSDIDILKSFLKMNDFKQVVIDNTEFSKSKYQLRIGDHIIQSGLHILTAGLEVIHKEQYLPPNSYVANYIWTKEGFKILTSSALHPAKARARADMIFALRQYSISASCSQI